MLGGRESFTATLGEQWSQQIELTVERKSSSTGIDVVNVTPKLLSDRTPMTALVHSNRSRGVDVLGTAERIVGMTIAARSDWRPAQPKELGRG